MLENKMKHIVSRKEGGKREMTRKEKMFILDLITDQQNLLVAQH